MMESRGGGASSAFQLLFLSSPGESATLHGPASRPSLIPRFLGRQGQSPSLPLSIVQTHTCVGLMINR